MNIFFFIGGLVVISCLVITALVKSDRRKEAIMLEKEIELLRQERDTIRGEIKEALEQLENTRVDKKTMLPHAVNSVLNRYDRSNIRIPSDIIEDLSYINFRDEKAIFDYIETQRHHWKLENTKKMNIKAGA